MPTGPNRIKDSGYRNVMTPLGGTVSTIIYPMMGHTVNEEELIIVRGMMSELSDNVSVQPHRDQ